MKWFLLELPPINLYTVDLIPLYWGIERHKEKKEMPCKPHKPNYNLIKIQEILSRTIQARNLG